MRPFHLPYPAFIGLIGQLFTSPTPRPLSLFLGLGGIFSLPGAYAPSSHHHRPWPNPLYWGGFGLNGLLGPFRPPTSSTAHSPWGHYSPFGPDPMRQKGAKGAVHQPPMPVHGLWQPPESTSSAPSKDSPQAQGKTFPSSMHPVLKDQGVVHIWHNIPLHTIFAQQSNVKFSGTNEVITNQAPNTSPILKEDSSATQSGNSLVATRRPFEDPNHLALQELGCQFSSKLF
ncbi:hypothetical protein O181_048148 [Austropuccinia psidii MF-1]|uniref:Uncharacterized protein n=1 Tax=Austropuccinia psidii MF-1 TaxID=1389203 RepID=A0A9Q3HK74_9BASI|nr:hypothetical protein [Austropuccinia psidii MF-1]